MSSHKPMTAAVQKLRASLARLWAKYAPDGQNPLLELQYHPGDIRKQVRYFFLTARHLRRIVLGTVAAIVFLTFALAITPRVVGDQLAAREQRALLEQRAAEGKRLTALVAQLEALEPASDEVWTATAKIHMAYGLPGEAAVGQGGYPFTAAAVPESIHSTTIARGNELAASIHERLGVLESFLSEVRQVEAAQRDLVRITPSISPLRGDYVLTSPFGNRRSPFTDRPDFHKGVDFAAPLGMPVYAPADGVVRRATWMSQRQSVSLWRYGKLVEIDHGGRFVTRFGHCDELRVKRGDKVRRGDVIGTVGNTGWSTSPHLHYEVWRVTQKGCELKISKKGCELKDPRIYILDRRWRNEEEILVRARSAPDMRESQTLPQILHWR